MMVRHGSMLSWELFSLASRFGVIQRRTEFGNRPASLTPRFSAFILKYCSLRDLRLCAHFRGPSRYGVGAAEVPMFIEIKDLETNPIDFREEYSPGAIDLGPDLRQVSPLHTEGRADLVEEHHGKHKIIQDIRLKGKLDTSLEADCARCIEPVIHQLSREFDLLYRPLGSDAGRDEVSVTDAEGEIG